MASPIGSPSTWEIWGSAAEIVTGAAPLYSSEYTQGAWDAALRFLIPALLEHHTCAPERVAQTLHPFVGHRMAKAGLELAVLDAAGIDSPGDVADRLPAGTASALTASAREAFTAGLGTTAAIGVAVMLAAAALVALVWRAPAAAD